MLARAFGKYAPSFFLWTAGAISLTADLVQKPQVAFYVAIALLVAGIICLLPGVSELLRLILGEKIDSDFTSRPFALIVVFLAGALFLSSEMTKDAEDKGQAGYLSQIFPKLRDVQLSLGLLKDDTKQIQQQQTALKEDTSKLVDASARWVKFDLRAKDDMIVGMGPEGHTYNPRGGWWVMTNETSFMFDNMELAMTTPENVEIARETIGFVKSSDQRWNETAFVDPVPVVTLCVSAKRRGSDEWLMEKVTYRRVKPDIHSISKYIPLEGTGVISSSSPKTC